MDIPTLMQLVEQKWPCDESVYPSVAGLTLAEKRSFEFRHVLLHQAEAVGNLSAACEREEHGQTLEAVTIRKNIRRLLVNTMRLASIAGLRADALSSSSSTNGPRPSRAREGAVLLSPHRRVFL